MPSLIAHVQLRHVNHPKLFMWVGCKAFLLTDVWNVENRGLRSRAGARFGRDTLRWNRSGAPPVRRRTPREMASPARATHRRAGGANVCTRKTESLAGGPVGAGSAEQCGDDADMYLRWELLSRAVSACLSFAIMTQTAWFMNPVEPCARMLWKFRNKLVLRTAAGVRCKLEADPEAPRQHQFIPGSVLANSSHSLSRAMSTMPLRMPRYLGGWPYRQRQVDIVYLDFEKAFDCVSHPKLLLKLKPISQNDSLLS